MNNDEFEGQWRQIKSQARHWWSKLTDADLKQVEGKLDNFLDILQAKYGYPRATAEAELNQRMAQYDAKQKRKKNDSWTPALNIAEGQWKQMRGQALGWWDKLTDADLDKAAGQAEITIGLIQEKYSYTREHAEAEFKRRVKEYEAEAAQKEIAVPLP